MTVISSRMTCLLVKAMGAPGACSLHTSSLKRSLRAEALMLRIAFHPLHGYKQPLFLQKCSSCFLSIDLLTEKGWTNKKSSTTSFVIGTNRETVHAYDRAVITFVSLH